MSTWSTNYPLILAALVHQRVMLFCTTQHMHSLRGVDRVRQEAEVVWTV